MYTAKKYSIYLCAECCYNASLVQRVDFNFKILKLMSHFHLVSEMYLAHCTTKFCDYDIRTVV